MQPTPANSGGQQQSATTDTITGGSRGSGELVLGETGNLEIQQTGYTRIAGAIGGAGGTGVTYNTRGSGLALQV